MAADGCLVLVPGSLSESVELRMFKAAKMIDWVQRLQAVAIAANLNFSINMMVNASMTSIQQLCRGEFDTLQKFAKHQLDTQRFVLIALPERMEDPQFENGFTEDGGMQKQTVTQGSLERGEDENTTTAEVYIIAMVAQRSLKYFTTQSDEKTWDLKHLEAEFKKLEDLPGYLYILAFEWKDELTSQEQQQKNDADHKDAEEHTAASSEEAKATDSASGEKQDIEGVENQSTGKGQRGTQAKAKGRDKGSEYNTWHHEPWKGGSSSSSSGDFWKGGIEGGKGNGGDKGKSWDRGKSNTGRGKGKSGKGKGKYYSSR